MCFTDSESVDSLLISREGGDSDMFASDALKLATVSSGTGHLWQIRAEIETDQPMGRLRSVEYRGVLSAAMIYDRQPVIDYFRSIARWPTAPPGP